jgi:uncharacterized protein
LTADKRYLADSDQLPLTCTRSGVCCHGKDIRITPWELARLAEAAGMAPVAFRDRHTTDGGACIAMSGAAGWRGQRACALYDPSAGCTVHAARPLACRLYPLGRERLGDRVRYMHEGRSFPCLTGCPEVESLPHMSVGDYLAGQGVDACAAPRDAYLDVAQDLAEGAFVLVFDTGLSGSTDSDWLARWRQLVQGGAAAWVATMGPVWHDRITAPVVAWPAEAGEGWVAAHATQLQEEVQAGFGGLSDPGSLSSASATLLAAALLLVHAVGGDATDVGNRWLSKAGQG